MTEKITCGYTQRQLDLIKGIIKPINNDEYNYIQDHCNDDLPPLESLSKKPDPQKPSKFVPKSRPKSNVGRPILTNAQAYFEAMERKED